MPCTAALGYDVFKPLDCHSCHSPNSPKLRRYSSFKNRSTRRSSAASVSDLPHSGRAAADLVLFLHLPANELTQERH